MRNIFTILLLALTLHTPAKAQQLQYIDSIVAIVEDDVITNQELFEEVSRIRKEFSSQGRRLPPEGSLNRQVLELMITKSIIFQEAKARGVKITDTQLNTTLQGLAKRNNLTLAQFREALIEQGMDYNKFREDIKKELAITRIQNGYASQNVDVSEQEVDDFMHRNSEGSDSLEYRLSHILISLPDGASSEQVSEARTTINAIAERLEAGEDFAELASTLSAGNNALQGGDLGWLESGTGEPAILNAVAGLSPGDIAGPIRTPRGYHVIKVVEGPQMEPTPLSELEDQIRYRLRQALRSEEWQRLLGHAGLPAH